MKIIAHNEAPSGSVKFYNYKEPFMKNEEPYFGFKGVLLHDATEPLIQCSECGEWVNSLGSHIKKHKLTARNYKIKFGLKMSTALVSEELREKLMENAKNGIKNAKKFVKGTSKKGVKTDRSMEQRNNFGTCPEQILHKAQELRIKLKCQPSFDDFRKEYKGVHASLIKIYGSWTNVCKLLDWKTQKAGVGLDKFEWNERKLIELLQNFKRTHNREPLTSDLKRGLLPSLSHFQYYFGNNCWTKAKEIAFGRAELI